jgi:hypothetical protein
MARNHYPIAANVTDGEMNDAKRAVTKSLEKLPPLPTNVDARCAEMTIKVRYARHTKATQVGWHATTVRTVRLRDHAESWADEPPPSPEY